MLDERKWVSNAVSVSFKVIAESEVFLTCSRKKKKKKGLRLRTVILVFKTGIAKGEREQIVLLQN